VKLKDRDALLKGAVMTDQLGLVVPEGLRTHPIDDELMWLINSEDKVVAVGINQKDGGFAMLSRKTVVELKDGSLAAVLSFGNTLDAVALVGEIPVRTTEAARNVRFIGANKICRYGKRQSDDADVEWAEFTTNYTGPTVAEKLRKLPEV
jgi:hypothetical protein